jgi:hypothetical protein
MSIKGFLIVLVLAIAGNYAAERWVLKDPNDPNDPGFVDFKPGFGMDDVARGATIALAVIVGGGVLKKALGGKRKAA